MYLRYAQRTRTRHTLLHAEQTDTGTRSATLRVHPRPGQRWHTEHGVHRITHLSGTGSGRGRRHTSFVAVEALEDGSIAAECQMTLQASGPFFAYSRGRP